jgi:1,4-alpha-glucan branching enzyme
MWAHPGKKLMFMGGEFGQWKEWNSREALDWALLDFPTHQGVMTLVRELNAFYRAHPAMYVRDNDWTGFEWVDLTDYASSVISFLRKAPDGSQILWIFNFTPVVREGYCRAAGSRASGRRSSTPTPRVSAARTWATPAGSWPGIRSWAAGPSIWN